MVMPTFVQILDFIGTFAFAVSGIRLASAKRFDWFGAYVCVVWVIIFGKHIVHLNNTLFTFDAIGLALFTVVGCGKALALGHPFWVAIIMGSITGAAGGVIRDVLINETPLIFRKEIYAMACVVGGTVYWACWKFGADAFVCQVAGGVTVFVVRVLSVKYNICLPILSGGDSEGKGAEKPKE